VWDDSLTHEIALALAASAPSAGKTMRAAWELGARLPEIAALLQTGIIDAGKARLVTEIFQELSDESAGRAEQLLVLELTEPPAKTYTQVERIATAIALMIDPQLGERRRKTAEKHRSRVEMFRERAGTAALTGRDLPTDQTLSAFANVNTRAAIYKAAPVFAKARMDQLRAAAYLDLLTGISAQDRIAHGLLTEQTPTQDQDGANAAAAVGPDGQPRPGGTDCPCRECDGSCLPDDDDPGDDDPGDGSGPGGSGPDGGAAPGGGPDPRGSAPGRGDHRDDGGGPGGKGPGGADDHRGSGPAGDDLTGGSRGSNRSDPCDDDSPGRDRPGNGHGPDGGPRDRASGESRSPGGGTPGPGPGQSPSPSPSRGPDGPHPVLQDLVFPLATLLGLADRPGEGHGLGALDPDLCRTLAATAVLSPHTTLCLTITDHDGTAIGHGCAKPARPPAPTRTEQTPHTRGPAPPLAALPARINLTITASQLTELAGQSRTGWAITPRGTPDTRTSPAPPGDPDWCRPWTLTLPDGRDLTVRPEPMPTYECDHRNESHAYQPNAKLRHLVQVRDHLCTFPTCSRHARDSDFEHAVPYDKGGRTCACNTGARSRQCHRVKQSPGWNVTQPKPGWHQWTTPRGRTYTQGPNRYPV
jgi:hypothetical protein